MDKRTDIWALTRVWYSRRVDSAIRRFDSFDEADEADVEYYALLTPQERLEILFDLSAMFRDTLSENSERFERVYRVVELEQC